MAPPDLLKRSISLLLKSQTNILSAAYVIMGTVIVSQLLGIVKQRLQISIFGPSAELGIVNYATYIPDTLFQATVGAAITASFIPVFSTYINKGEQEAGNKLSSTFLLVCLSFFFLVTLILFFLAPFVLTIFNLGNNFNQQEMNLMAQFMRIILFGQLIFIIAQFFTALLQSYNRFFIPGIASAMYNLGSILAIYFLSPIIGIYSVPFGILAGSIIYAAIQFPFAKRVGFSFVPKLDYLKSEGLTRILHITIPRSITVIIFQFGTLAIASIISFLQDPGRTIFLYELAKTIAYAPVSLVGLSIAQAAFPILSRERDRVDTFKQTFISSMNQMLYLILPISALILVLRVPIVRLLYGADTFDWDATVLTGRILALLSLSIASQAVTLLVYRAYWAIHDSKTPLVVGSVSTAFIISLSFIMVVVFKGTIESIALSLTLGSIFQLIILLVILNRSLKGFEKLNEFISLTKLFICTLCTGLAIYIPIKLLDKLVFETEYTIELIMLTGIASLAGLTLYLFLTWFLSIKEAETYILMFKRIGNWKDILKRSDEVLEPSRSINS